MLPHIGWNTVEAPEGRRCSRGWRGTVYFVHTTGSGAGSCRDPGRTVPAVDLGRHDDRFVAAVENGPLAATQFHPEKSGDAGAHLLATW